MAEKQLYFIAIIPPEPIYSDAAAWKRHFAEKYNSKAGLRSPPHITLHMPFKWREDREERIFEVLDTVATKQNPFEVAINGFGAFPPRVIFMNVEASGAMAKLHDDLKKEMKFSLNIFNAQYKDRGFNPHLTLAFRDLKKSVFPAAWKEFQIKEYKATVMVDKIMLLKHNGKTWDCHKELHLQQGL